MLAVTGCQGVCVLLKKFAVGLFLLLAIGVAYALLQLSIAPAPHVMESQPPDVVQVSDDPISDSVAYQACLNWRQDISKHSDRKLSFFLSYGSTSDVQEFVPYHIPSLAQNPFGQVIEVLAIPERDNPCPDIKNQVIQILGDPDDGWTEGIWWPSSPHLMSQTAPKSADLALLSSSQETGVEVVDIGSTKGIVYQPFDHQVMSTDPPSPGRVIWQRDGILYSLIGTPGSDGTPTELLLSLAQTMVY